MKFYEKLRNLRKERKMSQEDLADTLNVSRQAVSKWESGSSYPEMEKLLEICKIFDCTLEELTNEKMELENKGKTKKYISYIEYNIKKTINMFSNMNLGQIIKMIIIMFIVALCITIIKIPINYLEHIGARVFLQYDNIFCNILNNTWYFLLNIVYIFISVLLFIYIFKIKYLDNYVIKMDNVQNGDNKSENESIPTYVENKNNGKFIDVIYKLIMMGIKAIVLCMCVPFIFASAFIMFGIVILIWLFIKGVPLIGAFIGGLGALLLVILVLILVIHFVLDKKVNVKKVIISFIVGIIAVGIGCGVFALEMTRFNLVNKKIDLDKATSVEKEYKYNDNLEIHSFISGEDINYIEDNTLNDRVVIKVYYYKDYTTPNFVNEEDSISIYSGDDEFNKEIIYDFVDGLKQNEVYIYNGDNVRVEIYSSVDNINKLKSNLLEK